MLSQLLTDLQHICCQSSSLSSTLWQVALEFPHSVMEVIHTAWRSILFFTAWWSILFTVDRFKISLWKISQPHITRIHEFLTNMIIDNRLHNPMIWLSAPSCFLLAWHFYWIYDVCEMLPTFSAGNWLFNDLISDIFRQIRHFFWRRKSRKKVVVNSGGGLLCTPTDQILTWLGHYTPWLINQFVSLLPTCS